MEVRKVTIELREGTAAEWTAANPILRAGEAGVETDTFKLKVGNGIAAWAALPYFLNEIQVAALIQTAIDNAELVGVPGDSAYDVAVENGFVGTEEEWLESLIGPQGPAGTNGTNGTNGSNGVDGEDGAPGADGEDGAPGSDGADGESVQMFFVDYEDWPPAADANPLHLYWRLAEV